MVDVRRTLPTIKTPVKGAKKAAEEDMLRRAVEQAEKKALRKERSKRHVQFSDRASEAGHEKSTTKDETPKGKGHEKSSSFLEWKEPVLR